MFLPLALNRFVFPKLTVACGGVLLALLVPARGRLSRLAVGLLSAGALWLLVAALVGSSPVAALVGRPPRYEGVFVLPVYLGCAVAGARLLGPDRARGSTAWFLRCLSIAAIAIGIEAILETAGLRPLASNVARPGSLLGNASDEGAWALLALGPLGAVALRVGGRLHIAGALAAAATLACSGSRGALVGGLAAAAILAASSPRGAVRTALGVGLAAIAIATLVLPTTRARVTSSDALAAQTVTGRELLALETVRLIAERPLLGVGPSGYLDAIPTYHDRQFAREIGPANPPDSPHDWILQAAADGGVILALLAIALAGLTVRNGLRATRAQPTSGEAAAIGGILAGVVGYGTALLFHLTSPGTTPLAAVLAGALLAVPQLDEGRNQVAQQYLTALRRAASRTKPPARVATRLALAALTLALAAAAAAEIPLRSAIDAAATGRFTAANTDFTTAQTLRPWDDSIAAIAAHAYATLATDGIVTAPKFGAPWVAKALAAYPDWIQPLSDAATIDLTMHRPVPATELLRKAVAHDPANPDMWRQLQLADSAAGFRKQAAIAAKHARDLSYKRAIVAIAAD